MIFFIKKKFINNRKSFKNDIQKQIDYFNKKNIKKNFYLKF